MKQKVYWNRVAKEKKFTIPLSLGLIREYVCKDGAILDFGCGYGRMLDELKRDGFSNLAGVDIAENMIEMARVNLPDADFKVNSGVEIPYDDECFDAVIILAVLTCVADSDEQKKLMDEVRRVLKDGGIIYLCDFLINNDRHNTERYNKYLSKHGTYGIFEIEGGAVLRHHSLEWIDELVNDFEKIRFDRKKFVTMNGHESKGFCFLGKKV